MKTWEIILQEKKETKDAEVLRANQRRKALAALETRLETLGEQVWNRHLELGLNPDYFEYEFESCRGHRYKLTFVTQSKLVIARVEDDQTIWLDVTSIDIYNHVLDILETESNL